MLVYSINKDDLCVVLMLCELIL